MDAAIGHNNPPSAEIAESFDDIETAIGRLQ